MKPQPLLLDKLRKVVGDAQVLTQDLLAYEQDWRKRYQGRALAVVKPGSTQELAAVVQACAAAGASMVPQGGNTGLVGGGVPDDSGEQVVVNLQRMNRVRDIDRANATITVEAGCTLQAVQQAAQDAGWFFPLSLAAEGSCTIGGNLATNAGGTQVLRYGNARDLCLGLEWVTPTGQICAALSGLRKDNTGYDLKQLLIGSEGTLGLITAATLKLFPQPVSQLTAWCVVPDLPTCVQLLQLAKQQCGPGLSGFEVMNTASVALVQQHFAHLRLPVPNPLASSWHVLLELSDHHADAQAQATLNALLEAALAQTLIADAVIAQSGAQAQAMWHIRETIPLAQAQEGLNIKHDISLPISAIPAFFADNSRDLQTHCPGLRLICFGHLGDGNLHHNVQAPLGVSAADFLHEHEAAVNRLVFDAVHAHQGSISAEHGIGQLKRDTLPDYKSPVALALMHSIKQAWDPQNLMNPGRLLTAKAL